MAKHENPVELREEELHSTNAGVAGKSAGGFKLDGETKPANPIADGPQPKQVIWDVLID